MCGGRLVSRSVCVCVVYSVPYDIFGHSTHTAQLGSASLLSPLLSLSLALVYSRTKSPSIRARLFESPLFFVVVVAA